MCTVFVARPQSVKSDHVTWLWSIITKKKWFVKNQMWSRNIGDLAACSCYPLCYCVHCKADLASHCNPNCLCLFLLPTHLLFPTASWWCLLCSSQSVKFGEFGELNLAMQFVWVQLFFANYLLSIFFLLYPGKFRYHFLRLTQNTYQTSCFI